MGLPNSVPQHPIFPGPDRRPEREEQEIAESKPAVPLAYRLEGHIPSAVLGVTCVVILYVGTLPILAIPVGLGLVLYEIILWVFSVGKSHGATHYEVVNLAKQDDVVRIQGELNRD